MANDSSRELSVEELEEVAGGSDEAAAANIVCPVSNEKSCNSGCKPATATDAAAAQ